MHRLQPVAGIRQGASHDDAHGVVEVGVAHLLVDVNAMNGTDIQMNLRRPRDSECSGLSAQYSHMTIAVNWRAFRGTN